MNWDTEPHHTNGNRVLHRRLQFTHSITISRSLYTLCHHTAFLFFSVAKRYINTFTLFSWWSFYCTTRLRLIWLFEIRAWLNEMFTLLFSPRVCSTCWSKCPVSVSFCMMCIYDFNWTICKRKKKITENYARSGAHPQIIKGILRNKKSIFINGKLFLYI